MKKYLLFALLYGCASNHIDPKLTTEKPHQAVLAPEAPLNEAQTLCLTEGVTSLVSGKRWLKQHHPEACQDEETINSIYNGASAIGHNDALRIVAANQLQCFAQVNQLPPEGVEVMDRVAKQIMAKSEMHTLSELINPQSCLSVDLQQVLIKGGFSCGLVVSLASNDAMQTALSVYVDAADATDLIDKNNKEQQSELLIQNSMCYKMVLDSLRQKIGSSEDDDTKNHTEENLFNKNKIINL